MSTDILAVGQGILRGTDSNSLLRMYDLLLTTSAVAPSRLERQRADRALGRIAKELQKRHVHL